MMIGGVLAHVRRCGQEQQVAGRPGQAGVVWRGRAARERLGKLVPVGLATLPRSLDALSLWASSKTTRS